MTVHIRPGSIDDLVGLLASGQRPEVGYSAVLMHQDDESTLRQWRVWQLGDLARIEEPPGRVALIAGENRYWRAGLGVSELVESARTSESRFSFQAGVLMLSAPRHFWSSWLGSGPELVMNTLTMVTHRRRPAWRFTAPVMKGGTSEIGVDVETGVVVYSRRKDVGLVREVLRLRRDPSLTPSFFQPQRHDGRVGGPR